tara:strand:+ start:449 stop:805 length:357 start_codon:yes stop_codon:yes gene_type:complete
MNDKQLKCPECDADMILRNSKYGKFYGCLRFPLCKATHGAHPNGKPLGVPANAELKKLRMKAHEALGERFGVWELMTRNDKQKMYKWLKKHTRTGHVGSMTKEDIYDLLGKLRVVYEN